MYTAIFSRGLASEFRKFGEAEGDALAVAKTPRRIRHLAPRVLAETLPSRTHLTAFQTETASLGLSSD